MQHKLPENIDQLDSFYKEHFEDFSPEVSDTVWKTVQNNIPSSTGFSVSTSYMLKVVGLMLGSIVGLTVAVESLDSSSEKVNKPIIESTSPYISPESENVSLPEETISTTDVSKNTTDSSVVKKETDVKKNKETNNNTEKQSTTDFQFIEELEIIE